MKVGVLVQFTSKTDIEAKFTELKELGVDSCQLVCWEPWIRRFSAVSSGKF